jgi:hypothetical protein
MLSYQRRRRKDYRMDSYNAQKYRKASANSSCAHQASPSERFWGICTVNIYVYYKGTVRDRAPNGAACSKLNQKFMSG